MRYQVGSIGIGGRDESWFYAEYVPEKGQAFWVHEWNNLSYSLQTTEGERKVPLEEAKGERFYREAVAVIQEKHPEWQPLKA